MFFAYVLECSHGHLMNEYYSDWSVQVEEAYKSKIKMNCTGRSL